MSNKLLATLRQLFLFGIVGIATLAVDVAVTFVTFEALGNAFIASAIGFLSGFFVNFPLNRGKVFRHDGASRFSLRTQIVLYLSLSGFNLVATSALVAAGVALGAPIVLAKIVVTVVFFFWNYVALRLFIFSRAAAD